jgi:hypothetical protein
VHEGRRVGDRHGHAGQPRPNCKWDAIQAQITPAIRGALRVFANIGTTYRAIGKQIDVGGTLADST